MREFFAPYGEWAGLAATAHVRAVSARARYGCARKAPRAQVGERLVGSLQRVGADARLDGDLRGERQELLAVGARQVGDRAQHALLPQGAVGESRDVCTCGCRRTRPCRRSYRGERQRDERADGRENDRRVQRLRWELLRGARPHGAELARECLCLLVAGAREGVDLAPLVAADLREDVRRGAKAVQPDALRVAAHAQRAVANQPRAHQRSGLVVGIAGRDRKAVARVGNRVLGHPAVDVTTGEAGPRAQVLATAQTPAAFAAAPAEPGHADAIALARERDRRCPTVGLGRLHRLAGGLDGGDDLMAEHARRGLDLDLAVEQVQVGSAHAARVHAQQQLPGAR